MKHMTMKHLSLKNYLAAALFASALGMNLHGTAVAQEASVVLSLKARQQSLNCGTTRDCSLDHGPETTSAIEIPTKAEAKSESADRPADPGEPGTEPAYPADPGI